MHFRNTTKIAVQVLALCFLLSLLLSLFSNYELFMYFCFCFFFHLYGSFNHANSTSLSSLSFLNSFYSYYDFLNLYKVILHFHLPGVTSDIIMLVLHESFMFFASLCILDVHLVSFHHASSRFLRVPVCSSSGLLLIGNGAGLISHDIFN